MVDVDVTAWIDDAAQRIADASVMLAELDAAIGDGDHGHNLDRGMRAAREALHRDLALTPDAQMLAVGKALQSKGGGASGVLWGAFFKAAAGSLPTQDTADPLAFAHALGAGVAAMRRLGAAEAGDKTMLDVLAPVVETLIADLERMLPAEVVFAGAGAAARTAVEATRPMRARKGRAAYVGDRSIGHLDPGATSAAMLLDALTSALVP